MVVKVQQTSNQEFRDSGVVGSEAEESCDKAVWDLLPVASRGVIKAQIQV